MAFTQYKSAELQDRIRRQNEYEEYLAKKMSKEEDERQKYAFSLTSPDVIPNYMDSPTKKGEENMGQGKKRTGRIYTPEPKVDDRISPQLQKALFLPIKVEPSDPLKILLKPSRKKSNSRTAKKIAKDKKRFTLKRGRGGGRRKQRGGKRIKSRKNKRSKRRHVKKRKTRKRRKKRR